MPVVPKNILEEIRCISLNIHHEARGEPLKGQIAIANVTVNRTKSGKFPRTACKVIRQAGQFGWYKRGVDYRLVTVSKEIRQIAYDAITNQLTDHSRGALYFNDKPFNFKTKLTTKIGKHYFYKD